MPQVKVEQRGAVQLVRLARPEKKNALTVAMYQELTAALAAARADPGVRVVLITGEGGAFTGGNDIGDFLQRPPQGEASPVQLFLDALRTFDKPLVAAVDGVAVGIGGTLLLHCDLVAASTRARFALPFTKLGIVPEAGSTLLLPALVGLQRASEWLLLGEPFSAAEAKEAGLCNRVVEPEELEPTALALAEAVAARPPEAIRLTRKLLRTPFAAALAEAMRREGKAFVERLASEEARAALLAFVNRLK